MEIKTEKDYQEALKRRAELLEAYSFLGTANADSLDKQISEVDSSIALYEAAKTAESETVKLMPSQVLEALKIENENCYTCVHGRIDNYFFDMNNGDGEWYIQVDIDGSFIYDGVWKDSYHKTPLEAVTEALNGAQL